MGNTTGLTITTGDGTGDTTTTFTGTISNINTALNGLSFTPTANYNGAASIQITTNDLGNGGGAGLSVSDTVAITVNPVDDAFVITPGTDVINAGNGNDTVTSTFANLRQNDNLNGETGTDTFILTGGAAVDKLTINVATTNNQLSDITGTTISNFERFDLSSFPGLTTMTGSDSLNDILISGAGNDRLGSGAGNDTLTGNAGNDQLIGGAGDDILTGGVGGDILTGGEGSDRFVFNASTERRDSIIDFSVADTIDVSKAGFGSGLSTNATNATISLDQFRLGSTATATTHRFIYNASTGGLFFDADGTGGTLQVQLATLSTGLGITNQDIFVIA